jgi:hypothetical protein
MAYVPPHRRVDFKKANMSHKCQAKKMEDPRKIFREVMKDLLLATHCHGCKREYPVTLVGYCGQYCKKSCWEMIWIGDLPEDQMHSCYRFQNTSCKMCMEIPISKTISMYHRPYFENLKKKMTSSKE